MNQKHFSKWIIVASVIGATIANAPLLWGQSKEPASDATRLSEDEAARKEKTINESLSKLSLEDRKLAESQRFCAEMSHERLGEMGEPIKLVLEGKPVFVCCEGCVDEAKEHAKEVVAKVDKLRKANTELAKLSIEERKRVEAQKYCAISEKNFLGIMCKPIKLVLEGQPVYLCCEGCVAKAKSNPKATAEKVQKLIREGTQSSESHESTASHDEKDSPRKTGQ